MTLIIRVDPARTVQTCILLTNLCGEQVIPIVDDGCGRQRLDAYALVSRAGCRDTPPPKKIWCGCSYIEQPVEPEPAGVRYRAWELDDQGRVCFYWDDLLLDQKPGRYDVAVHIADKPAASFQVDLRSAIRITEVVNRQARACANC